MSVTISGSDALVLQANQATSTTVQTITSQTWVDLSGMSVSITPKSTSSRIKVSISIACSAADGTSSATQLGLFRNGTQVGGGAGTNGGWGFVGMTSYMRPQIQVWNFNFIDSPATTAALTYKISAYLSRGAGTFVFNQYQWVETWSGQSGRSTIIVEELAQ